MSRHERRAMIDRGHHELSVVRQCELLDISRSSAYYSPVQADEYELELMGLVDKQYLLTPFYGSRKMAVWLRGQGHQVNSQAGSEADATDGHRGHLPPTEDHHAGFRTQGVSLPAQRP